MNSSHTLIIAILVCSLILAAGCIGRAVTTVPATPTPVQITLELLVITP